ncbi:hypothetical protein [Rhizobium laguerreae]|uniref:hypothetical protein n=1 Tax=Rhizobium laguerreae TaxID=1076926 RepID=UPI001C8FD5EA|nr:hypothetical protein [Rhizobium laguerreae]MBY3434810.1 hypothetical protein [Rhizobium laguerreae]MBY3448953.1 hypothetical protein [Rhizobium laguerreae]MBY3456727.1 hypothetical protein [Rhizobium laguerreae]
MKLVSNPGRVLVRSLSMWCIYAAGLAEIIPYIVPYLDAFIPTWLSIALLLASPLLRVVDQGGLSHNANQ